MKIYGVKLQIFVFLNLRSKSKYPRDFRFRWWQSKTFCGVALPGLVKITRLATCKLHIYLSEGPTREKKKTTQHWKLATSNSSTLVAERNPGTNIDSGDVIRAINELKNDIKGHNDCLRQEIIQLRQEVNGKLDNLATAVQSLSDRIDEAESRLEQVEGWTEEATETLCTYLKRQRSLQQKLMDLESWSRGNNIRIFRVAEGEEGNSVLQFVEKFIKSELPASQEMDLKIQRAHQTQSTPETHCCELLGEKLGKRGKHKWVKRWIYFDHDYVSEIIKCREYNMIKKALKQKGICFQTPYTSMQIHWATGVRTYSTTREAQRELKKCSFTVEEPESTEGECFVETQLLERMGWQQAAGRQEKGAAVARRAKEKLQEFQRGNTKDLWTWSEIALPGMKTLNSWLLCVFLKVFLFFLSSTQSIKHLGEVPSAQLPVAIPSAPKAVSPRSSPLR